MSFKKFSAFISCSFAEENNEIITFFCELATSLGFDTYIAKDGHHSPPTTKVRERIASADCLIAICTKEHEIAHSDKWKTSDWILNEIGMTIMVNKPIVAFVEKEVMAEGVLPTITSYKIFDRDNLQAGLFDYIELLNNLQISLRKELIVKPELSVSFIRKSYFLKTEIFEDGSSELTTEVEVLSLENNLETMTHRTYSEDTGDISLKATNFEFYSAYEDHNITATLKKNENKNVVIVVEFSPPLNANESSKYGFIKRSKRSNIMNLEEIEKMISMGTHAIKEPLDYEGILINTPTLHFKKELIFPRGFDISEIKYDVHVGRSENRDPLEYERVNENNFFVSDFFGNAWRLCLDVKNPKMGTCYKIFWKPPGKNQ